MMMAVLSLLRNITYLRYILSSAGALAVDMSVFMALFHLGLFPAAASALGYMAGIAAHWLLSSRAVFTDSVAARGRDRDRQKALFLGSALAGLAITTAIVGAGDLMGIDARLAKLVAIVISFQATYLMRKKVVFAE
ncbi:GtrA family protein [Rhizorhapis sp.]|uniref:GtrA family protein n=1 Tax=Rhizorhapis sp. TaxID=1968842 RepID=UPI002B4A0D3B|nr:GtrA family protein [Rhizorhapis sp.]HKR17481.1 GtrA family protein [Rhizorhapis sp.]